MSLLHSQGPEVLAATRTHARTSAAAERRAERPTRRRLFQSLGENDETRTGRLKPQRGSDGQEVAAAFRRYFNSARGGLCCLDLPVRAHLQPQDDSMPRVHQ